MKITPAVGVLFRSMQDKAIRNGTIIALVIVVVQLATLSWRNDAGTPLVLARATGLTLLFVIAWQRSETFRKVVETVFHAVGLAVSKYVGIIVRYIQLWIGAMAKISSRLS